jgi:hypothetical protein
MTGVITQIQDTMSAEQIAAISAMQLTNDGLSAMIADGTLALGFGGRGGFGGAGGAAGDRAGGGAGGFVPPPGGFPGGGPGGPGGAGGFQNVDPEELATRRAERFGAGGGGIMTTQFTAAVVRLLETKTGEAPADGGFAGRGNLFGIALDTVTSATGLSIEEVQALLAEAKTLAEVITDSGGDVASVQSELATALADTPQAQNGSAESLASDLLQGVLGGFQPAAGDGG